MLLFVLVYLFAQNSQETVHLSFFGRHYLGINIYWIVAVCFLLGFATSFVIAGLREFRFHREIGRLKKAMRAKDREIADLRTMPLSDQPVAGAPEGSVRDVDALPGPPEGAAP